MSNLVISENGTLYSRLVDGYAFKEDFLNNASLTGGLIASNLGGSANVTVQPTTTENRRGIVRLQTGTTAAVDQRGGYITNLTSFFPGDGRKFAVGFGFRTVGPSYFSGSLTGFYQLGITDVASSIGSGMLGFISIDGSNWLCRSSNGGVVTSFDTGLSVTATDWRDFYFIYHEGGSRIDFYDGPTRLVTFWDSAGVNDATNIYSENINKLTNRAGIKAMIHRTSATGTGVFGDLDYIVYEEKYPLNIQQRLSAWRNF